jgi:hypothetical protein
MVEYRQIAAAYTIAIFIALTEFARYQNTNP